MKKKYTISLVIFSLFVLSSLIFSYFPLNYDNSEYIPHSSGFTLTSPIFIDDLSPENNWENYAQTYPWCSGSGISTDPYLITNLKIDSPNSDGITIFNSNVFFILGGIDISGAEGSGIKFHNVTGGGILSCDIIDNTNCGIEILESSHCFMFDNRILANGYSGIRMYECANMDIEGSTIENNDMAGIDLSSCSRTKVESNTIISNGLFGVVVGFDGHVLITKNTISKHNNAIYSYRSSETIVSFNTLKKSSEFGVLMQYECEDGEIFNNSLEDNRLCIGVSECCEEISVYNNTECQVISMESDFGPPPFTEDELRSFEGNFGFPEITIPGFVYLLILVPCLISLSSIIFNVLLNKD
jgi:parallel beta-helix repeat protein